MRRILVILAVLLAPLAEAEAVELVTAMTSSTSDDANFEVRMVAQVFSRLRGTRSQGGEWNEDASLTRARLKIDVLFGTWLRANIEPDFSEFVNSDSEAATDNLDLSDVYLQVSPWRPLRFRVGQAKVPFGSFEIASRWEIPVIARGVTSTILNKQLDYVGRRFGAAAKLNLKDIPLKPRLHIGFYGDLSGKPNEDFGADLSLRLIKGGRLALQGFTSRASGGASDRGVAGSVNFTWDRFGLFAIVDSIVGTGAGLSPNPALANTMSTFLALRMMIGYRLKLGEDYALRPYFAIEGFDPNLETRDDLGGGIRGGLNFYWLKAFRVGFEFDRQAGQVAFVLPAATRLTLFVGVHLE